ncbi:transcriptional regulator with XRE-family HTH domain [Litorivivens lipolytica]|uniref:Transcriptional regulator with XRE-family HTH domain n=1 Tax=Litorivivens lipolytica TaxID=1524264 RepID=A0A7W4W7R7_9GAMM|nr:helix-turn-helix transcriptional regulator [Litorivivens lipolytica]MBB3048999.1 transcriptional regulator with XRE-family HTH domain [Litorivivens lipolytica]
MQHFGDYIREARLRLQEEDRSFSLRQVAGRVGIEPAYLSKIERGVFAPPSEATIVKIAEVLNEDADVLLAMAGKLSSDLQAIILQRPKLFADLLRQLKKAPDHAILSVVREVTDGDW